MKKILYVEDDEDTADAVKVILNLAGYEIHIARNGEEALKNADETFDLFLLDIMLPDMSGWDLFQKLQKQKLKAKYVFLSAIPVSNERKQALKKVGVSDYIVKPFEKDDLISQVKTTLK